MPVLSVDAKCQIRALERTQPGLPLKPGKAGIMTHDDLRNRVTTLFAAFDALEGTVLGRCMQRHRHQAFLRFLNTLLVEFVRDGLSDERTAPENLCTLLPKSLPSGLPVGTYEGCEGF